MKKIAVSINHLITDGIALAPTQPKLCLPIIKRIYLKMTAGIKFADIKVMNSMICDGHHRYIASLLAGVEVGQVTGIATKAFIISWKSVILEEEDWDSPAAIERFNEEDAKFNSLEFEKIAGLLNKP